MCANSEFGLLSEKENLFYDTFSRFFCSFSLTFLASFPFINLAIWKLHEVVKIKIITMSKRVATNYFWFLWCHFHKSRDFFFREESKTGFLGWVRHLGGLIRQYYNSNKIIRLKYLRKKYNHSWKKNSVKLE